MSDQDDTKGSIRARLRRGLGGQAFSQAVALLVQLGSVPMYLHFWGATLYGEWLVLAAFPAYLVISDLGFTTATSHEITMRVARDDTKSALGAFQSTWVFVTAISVGVAAILVLGAIVSPMASWFGFSNLGEFGASAVLALLLFQVLVNIQTGLATSGLISAGQYGLSAFLTALTRLAGFILILIVLLSGGKPMTVAAVIAGVECVGFLVVFGFARRFSPWMAHGFTHASRAVFKRLAAPSIGFAGFIVGNAIVIQGPVIIIGATLGPVPVAIFATLRLLARSVVMFATAVFATLRPEIAMAYGRDDTMLMRKINTRAIQFSIWLSGLSFVALMVLGPWLVDLWTVGRIAVQQPLFAILLITGMGTLLWTGTATALYATNNNREIAAIYIIAAAAGGVSALILAPVVGLNGVAFAFALTEIGVFVMVLVRTLAFLDQRFWSLAGAVVKPPTDMLRVLRRGG